jgi:hypothetical protein
MEMGRSGTKRILYITLALATAGAGACAPPAPGDVDEQTGAIHLNAGSTGSVSIVADSTAIGPWPEVMNFKNNSSATCTATVVGPYAALTANHCTSGGSPTVMNLNWTDTGDIHVQNVWYNSYLNPTYTPSWWTTLNNQQKASGGRQDDWPAQHDQVILFVPTLTPAWLVQHNITPASIGAPFGAAAPIAYNTIGVASTGSGASRAWVPSQFIAANVNTITSSPRDGYLTEDQSTPNFGSVDPGDSGGPAMGFQAWPYLNGTTLNVGHFVVGTAQNTGGDKAPISYTTGTTLTTNQTLTVRLNSLFALATVDDADGDGLPTACDTNPAASNPGTTSLCPAEVGTPTGASLAGTQSASATSVPLGQVACQPGYFAIGLGGRSGALVDQLSVHCQALSCFYTGTCAGTNQYWTDGFGGPGGGAFDTECPSGSIVTGVLAQTVSGTTLSALQAECTPIASVVDNQSNRSYLSWVGGAGSAQVDNSCATNKSLVGFQTRSYDARWVTGIQTICSDDVGHFGPYMGGTGGGTADLTCPVGYVGTGLAYTTDSANSSIAFTGLLCAPSAAVRAGVAIPDQQLWIAHGQAHDYTTGVNVPALVEPFPGSHIPTGVQRVNCPNGDGLIALYGAVSTQSLSTGVVSAYTGVSCRQLVWPNAVRFIGISGAGTVSGATQESSGCQHGYFNGFYSQSGWLTDGIAPHCQ